MRIIKKKGRKEIFNYLEDRFGMKRLKLDHEFAKTNGRTWIFSKDVLKLNLKDLPLEGIGLYFGFHKPGEFRPSLEGSMIIGRSARKNVVKINEIQIKKWVKGRDLEGNFNVERGLVLIKYGDDIVGCGRFKNGKIMNFVRKNRRIIGEMDGGSV